MIKYRLIITETAVNQLEDSCLFYEERKHGLGAELEQEVAELLELIEANPLMFAIKFATMREAVVKKFPFVIVYEIIERDILVVSVFHVKQNPIKKKKK